MMSEAAVTAGLLRLLRAVPGWVVLKHNDAKTAGIPDISVTGGGLTTWLELKVGDKIKTRAIQHLMMARLQEASRFGAFYVLYSEEHTSIIAPAQMGWGEMVPVNVSAKPYDHDHVLTFLIGRHRCSTSRAR